MNEILDKVLERIKPDAEQVSEATAFVSQLNKRLKWAALKAIAEVGGSTAKGTFLKGDHDVDIFVRFDRETYRELNDRLSDLLETVLPKKAVRVHGSRDYYQIVHDGLTYEIVPVLKVSKPGQALNVTDMSPLHVKYIAKHLKKQPALADQIRLAKQFCKAIKVYGAESYINGFSGHVLDLLTLKYGSFERLLTAASGWGERLVIDPERHHKKAEFSIDENKQLGPMLIVDPVQPERNAAAALSFEKYERFKDAARVFLEQPALKYFTVEPLTAGRITKEYERRKPDFKEKTKLFIVEAVALEGKTDIVATKLLKLHMYLVRQLDLLDFTVIDNGFEFERGKSLSYIVVHDERLDARKEARGPPTSAKKDMANFKKKHGRNAYERGKRLYVKIKRPYTTPLQALKGLLKEEYVTGRMKKATLL
ncbi:CCA tRNA nucleotidyltransferase [Candidatus Woesearchaeota archaeon]|nr:CCA tRNA nucleotidyltransferase [Candidatus Woesearchaeota archaeon]